MRIVVVCAAIVAVFVFVRRSCARSVRRRVVSGRLLNSLSGDPIAGATVVIEELRRQTTSAADGTFTFDDVPPGSYHLSVQAAGLLVAPHGVRSPARPRR